MPKINKIPFKNLESTKCSYLALLERLFHRIFVAFFPEDAQVRGQMAQLGGQNLA